jgi:hypothetical protein
MSRLLTQKERCVFCFENPKGPKHLVVSVAVVEIDNKLIANFPTVLFAKYKFGMKTTREHTPVRYIVFYQRYSSVWSQVRLEESHRSHLKPNLS